jgi:hypothetical protein
MKKDIQKYIRKAAPEEWFDYARELKEAADTLWKLKSREMIFFKTEDSEYLKPNYSRTFFFLNGVSIENLLKGILISENPDFLRNGKISNEISTGHKLKDLALKVKTVDFDDNELKILDLLSEVVPYWGKYPIPKKFQDLKKEIHIDDTWHDQLNMLNKKLELKLYDLNRNGIKGPNGVDFPKLIIPHLDE